MEKRDCITAAAAAAGENRCGKPRSGSLKSVRPYRFQLGGSLTAFLSSFAKNSASPVLAYAEACVLADAEACGFQAA